jgi:hypothetical protein
MSCFNNNCYLPQPPRAWSRVQNSCSLITDTDNNGLVRDPYTGQLVPAVVLAERIAMLNKGNVLQYKANSSNLTKSQKYSKIAKGQWVNRNTTWAIQSTRGYTNPNTTSLKRDGNINIAIDPITGAIIGPTEAPPTCPQPINPVYPALPSNGGGGSSIIDPEIPPPVPPTPGSDIFPVIIPDTPPEPIVIQDGGIQDLCWNDGTQTWYPRQRYVMTNSTNKWPVNAELAGAIIIDTPVITSISSNTNIVTLTWTFNSSCLPASNFNIYQDGILVKVVDGNTFTTTITVDNCNIYEYYIIAENITAKATSEASNVVSIPVYYVEPPTNLSYTTIGTGSIQLIWGLPNPNCKPAVSYKIYQDGFLIDNTLVLNETVNGLTNCTSYIFSITSVDSNGNESLPAILNNVIPLWPNPPTSITWKPQDGGIILYWNPPIISCTTFSYYEIIVKDSPGGTIVQTLTTINPSINVTVLTNCNTYDFEITTVDINTHKSTSTLLNQQILWPGSPGNILGIAGDSSCKISWTAPTSNTCANSFITSYNGEYTDGVTIVSISGIPNSWTVSGLTNGTTYTFNIYTIAVINGYTCVSTNPSTIMLTPNVYYTLGPGAIGVSGTSGGYNYVYINTNIGGGLITFNLSNSYVSTVYVVCVAGGGGGGGAGDLGSSTDSGRGGGGAGCGVIQINSPIVNNSYTFNVGIGGMGGPGDEDDGGDGGDSRLLNPTGVPLIHCTSGKGGGSGPFGSANGAAGQQTVPSIANGGGQGGQHPGDGGSNSSTVGTQLSMTGLSLLPAPFSTSYGGGGGCGDNNSNGGGSGNNGVGGGGTSATAAAGQGATTSGSGGGGAGWTSSGVNYAGGNGATGLIGFWWQPLF